MAGAGTGGTSGARSHAQTFEAFHKPRVSSCSPLEVTHECKTTTTERQKPRCRVNTPKALLTAALSPSRRVSWTRKEVRFRFRKEKRRLTRGWDGLVSFQVNLCQRKHSFRAVPYPIPKLETDGPSTAPSAPCWDRHGPTQWLQPGMLREPSPLGMAPEPEPAATVVGAGERTCTSRPSATSQLPPGAPELK